MSLTLDRLANIAIVDSGGDELTIDASGFITANINGTVTVSASDLDIRDLTHVSDSVKIGDGTETANVNASNELQVRDDDANTLLGTIDADTSALAGTVSGSELQCDVLTMPGIYAEDSAHSSTDNGMFSLGVRQDADAAFGADGDYGPLQLDSSGFLKVSGNFSVTEDSYDTIKSTAESVGTSAAEIVATPLTSRKSIMLQNNGSAPIFIGPTGVTTSSGIEISKNSTMEWKASATVDIFAISTSAAQDLRCFEMGA